VLGPAVRRLSARDRRILYLRFFEGRDQPEIGAEIGVTQMQASRLLARTLRNLRSSIDEPAPGDVLGPVDGAGVDGAG
jgi:RNA polymerase sigma-B factor